MVLAYSVPMASFCHFVNTNKTMQQTVGLLNFNKNRFFNFPALARLKLLQ